MFSVGDRKIEQANIKMDIVKCIVTNKKVKRIWHEILLTKRKKLQGLLIEEAPSKIIDI